MTDRLAVKAHRVTKRLCGRPVLNGVNLAVHYGDSVGIIGENGVEKSLFLRILAGPVPFFIALVVSVGTCISSLWIRKVYTGPNVRVFHQWIADFDDNEASLVLLTTLENNYRQNRTALSQKGLYWTIAAIALVACVIVVGIDVAVLRGR